MGKVSNCFGSFLTGKREKERQPTPAPLPSTEEKNRWSFRRSTADRKELSATGRSASARCTRNGVSECEIERTRHTVAVAVAAAAAADAAVAAAQQAAAAVVKLRAVSSGGRTCRVLEEFAAVKIQAYFRSYLARRALCALKGLVKLQALIRGRLVRKQAAEALRHMHALVTAQARARAQRIKTAEEVQAISQNQPNNRRSPQHPRFQNSYCMENNAEESLKIVEMDRCEPRSSSKSKNGYSIPQSERNDYRHSVYYCGSQTPSKANIQLSYSPSPSTRTATSPKACSSHFEEFSFATTQYSPRYLSPISMPDSARGSNDYSFPNYMANTQSSRAKVRSQSAPRQRLDFYERQSSTRKQPVEGRTIPRSAKMQRSSSQAGFTDIGYEFPSHLKLDRSSASVRDSECGSTTTVLTNTN